MLLKPVDWKDEKGEVRDFLIKVSEQLGEDEGWVEESMDKIDKLVESGSNLFQDISGNFMITFRVSEGGGGCSEEWVQPIEDFGENGQNVCRSSDIS